MREKYKRKIREFAEQSLEEKLKQKIKPYMDYIPSEMQGAIKNEVMNVSLPDEESLGPKDRLGSKLQSEGRSIADKIIDKILKQTIPYIEKKIKHRKAELAKERLLADQSEDAIRNLKDKIENGFIRKSQYWRGADVIITPKHIPEENLAWTHTNDTQVVTETKELARSISWLFMQLRDIMSPFLDFRNKYEFYVELAETANKIINSDKEYNEKEVLVSILSKGESFRREWLSGLNDYFDREKTLLDEFENWVPKKP